MRRYSTIGYHAHCSVYSLRHKHRADRQQRKFPLFVEKKPLFERKVLAVEDTTASEMELVAIPSLGAPRIRWERKHRSLATKSALDEWVENG
jgi:hypothetical protein